MDQARIERWQRFYDDVVTRGGDWPRDLWFAAVGDAMAAALAPEEPLVLDFRRDITELAGLDRDNRGSYLEERRIGQLEAQITALIGQADDRVRAAAGAARGPLARPEPVDDDEPVPEPRPPMRNWGTVVGSIGLAVLVFGAAVATATHFYETRLASQVALEVDRHVQQIQRALEQAEVDLAGRLQAASEEGLRVAALREELAGQVEEVSGKVSASLNAMMALREASFADFQRQLDEHSGGLSQMLERLGQRAQALDRGLDQVSEDLAGLERRLPEVSRSLAGLGEEIEQRRADLGDATRQIATLRTLPPELINWVEAERSDLRQQIGERRAAIADLERELGAVKGEFQASGAALAGFRNAVAKGLEEVQRENEALEVAVQQLQETGAAAATLAAAAEADVEAMRRGVQKELDALLTEVAERADLAALRGEDALARAQAAASQRVEAATEETLAQLGEQRAAKVAALEQAASTASSDLEQARTGLVTSWQQMDRVVGERQHALLGNLDQHAQAMEQRVKEFLAALDVMMAQSAGEGG